MDQLPAAPRAATAECALAAAPVSARTGERLFRGNRTEILLVDHPSYGSCVQKRLLAFCDVETERGRIKGEATLQMRARLPGVVPVFGHDSSSLYRSYVQGPTLVEWIKTADKAPTLSQIASIVCELCATVAALHTELALVHRDITPSNVYLESNQVLLSDFGLAFSACEPPRPSEFLQGSPRFLPPELLAGQAPSSAGDVYQIALLLAWLLKDTLRNFVPPSARGLSVGEQWSRARAWHEPARQVLKAHGCDSALDPDPRERPSARELWVLIKSRS